jgi:anti-anti-sigma regulatory factor
VTASADTQVTDLAASDHACLTFGDQEELLDLVAAFARDGLTGGLRVVTVTDHPWRAVAQLARRGVSAGPAVAEGQIVPARWRDDLLAHGGFSAGQAMSWLRSQLAASRQAGYPGLRVALDMTWALRPATGVEELPVLEEQIAAETGSGGLSVLCGYDRQRFDPVTLASVTPTHTHSVAAWTYYADPVVRICRQYAPPGIRLAGELDFTSEEPLSQALAEALRLDGDITVNMTGLSVIDAACIRMIIDAARSVVPPRSMVLQCAPPVEARFVQFGVDRLPQIRVEAAHD